MQRTEAFTVCYPQQNSHHTLKQNIKEASSGTVILIKRPW